MDKINSSLPLLWRGTKIFINTGRFVSNFCPQKLQTLELKEILVLVNLPQFNAIRAQEDNEDLAANLLDQVWRPEKHHSDLLPSTKPSGGMTQPSELITVHPSWDLAGKLRHHPLPILHLSLSRTMNQSVVPILTSKLPQRVQGGCCQSRAFMSHSFVDQRSRLDRRIPLCFVKILM
jgi:hypothetical protein